jgi:hypothetical protein
MNRLTFAARVVLPHDRHGQVLGPGVQLQGRPPRGRAPSRGELRRFWKQMAQRTHPAVEHEPEPELDGRRRTRY